MSGTRPFEDDSQLFERHGFRSVSKGVYRHNGLALQRTPRWLVFTSPAADSIDPLRDLHGSAGLWKFANTQWSGQFGREFHLPANVLKGDVPFDLQLERDPYAECFEWARATLHGHVPAAWSPPSNEQLAPLVAGGGLTLQAGPIIRQGTLVCRPDRLAIIFPIVTSVPAELSAVRRELLKELGIDAQNRWRMVRIGWRDAYEERGLEAEVDLTGAPHSVLTELIVVAMDALRWVVRWSVNSAALLTDASVDCRAWQCCASGCYPRKGDESSC
jgi:hypothetical protein